MLVSTLLATIYHSSSLGLSVGAVGSKSLTLSDEQLDALAEALPTLRETCVVAKRLLVLQVRDWYLPAGFDT